MSARTNIHRRRDEAGPMVLVVEDNLVNRQLAQISLTSLGYRVDVADDGLQALERLAANHYAAIVMDCQMPNMDGYEATKEIRRREGGDRRTPIIALTAHAAPADRDKCLSVGMDDYLSKPFELAALKSVMARWAPVGAGEGSAPGELSAEVVQGNQGPAAEPSGNKDYTRASDGDAVLDPSVLEALLETCSASDLVAIVDIFASDTPTLVGEISDAVHRRDAEGLRRAAHTLKGSASNLGGSRLAALCERLERAARGDLDDAASPVAQLEPAFDQTLAALYEMLLAGDATR